MYGVTAFLGRPTSVVLKHICSVLTAMQVMSAASELFFGAIEQHEPGSMTFGQFLSLARRHDNSTGAEPDSAQPAATAAAADGTLAFAPRHGNKSAAAECAEGAAGAGVAAAACPADASHSQQGGNSQPDATHHNLQGGSALHSRHYYLAQADLPIARDGQRGGEAECQASGRIDGQQTADSSHANGHSGPRSSLAALADDFQPPPLLRGVAGGELQTNLWMSIRQDVARMWRPASVLVPSGEPHCMNYRIHAVIGQLTQAANTGAGCDAGVHGPACTTTHTRTCCAWCGARRRCGCTPRSRRPRCTPSRCTARCGFRVSGF